MAGAPRKTATPADDKPLPIALTTPIPGRPIAPSLKKPARAAAARVSSFAFWEAAYKGDHDALSRLAEDGASIDEKSSFQLSLCVYSVVFNTSRACPKSL